MIRGIYYNYVPLEWAHITAVRKEFAERIYQRVEPDEIRPFKIRPAFKDEYGPSWDKFEKIYQSNQGRVRKFSLMVFRGSEKENRFCIQIRIRENEDSIGRPDGYPSIEILLYDGEEHYFEQARRLLEKLWGLEVSEKQLKNELLARYQAAIRHPELKKKTESAMRSHDYDLALSGATILVESALRTRCLKEGCAAAGSVTGAELAVLAFTEEKGCLTPPYAVANRSAHGAFLLFQGFFLYLRNAYGHHSHVVGSDRTYVIEFLSLCDTLLSIVEGSTRRDPPPVRPPA